MAENKKVIISIVVDDKSAKPKLKGVGDEVEKTNKKFSKFGKTLAAIGRGFVIVKSFQLLARTITSTIKVAAEFEQTMAKVRATTGASEKEFKKLEKSARDLALGTIFTATQVGELQLAYSKLGFTTEEILNATEATLNLATATGEDLASAADVVGATIRGFGLDAIETQRVTDVMAKSFTSSALNLENFKQSMKTVAPIANAANVDLETTTALLGTLADSGLRGTRAATGLKNLMSQLSSPTSKLAKELGYTIKNSEGLIHAFKDLSERNIDLAKATGLTDERSKAAFITLVNGTSNVNDLRFSLNNANGAALRMSDIVGGTLIGSFKRFQSQVEETQIAVSNSSFLAETADFGSYLLTFLREGRSEAKALAQEMELEDEIKADFQKIIEAENEFYAIRKKEAVAFAKENERIISEVKDSEKANELIRQRNIEKRQEDERKYIEFLQNQIFNIGQLGRSWEKVQKRIVKKYNAFDPRINERIKKLKDAQVALEKELKDTQDTSKNLTDTIDGLNNIIVTTTESTYDWAKTSDDAFSVLNGRFSKFFKEAEWYEEPSGLMSWNDELAKLSDPTKMSTTADGMKLLGEQLQSLTDAFADGEVQTQDTFFARLFGVSDQEFQAVKDQLVDGSQELMNIGFDMLQVQLENRLNALQIANQREYDDFISLQDDKAKRFDIDMQHQLDSFTGTEQQKADFEKQKRLEQLEFEQKQESERQKLRQKQLDEENKIARNAFIANKANSIGNIAIDTARAIVATIAQLGGVGAITPAGAALIALMGTIGTAQTAVVASQRFQPKTFQDGGMIQGESHANGGVPFTVAGQAGFEAEGGEYIFSRKTVNRLGVDFLDSLNFGSSRQAPSMMFANGGSIPNVSRSSSINEDRLAEKIGMQVAMQMTEIPVVNVATETAQISRGILNAEAMATL